MGGSSLLTKAKNVFGFGEAKPPRIANLTGAEIQLPFGDDVYLGVKPFAGTIVETKPIDGLAVTSKSIPLENTIVICTTENRIEFNVHASQTLYIFKDGALYNMQNEKVTWAQLAQKHGHLIKGFAALGLLGVVGYAVTKVI